MIKRLICWLKGHRCEDIPEETRCVRRCMRCGREFMVWFLAEPPTPGSLGGIDRSGGAWWKNQKCQNLSTGITSEALDRLLDKDRE
jgi:hypothetical protein